LAAAGKEPDASDYCWYQELVVANVAPPVAERLIAFVPLAFAELLLPEAGHPREYQLMCGNEPGPTRQLRDEPAYAAAKELGTRLIRDPGPSGGFRALAVRSATFAAANSALKNGSRLEDLVFTNPIVLLGRFSAPGAEQGSAETPETEPRKPWWKVW
jgi:hypothetical protein